MDEIKVSLTPDEIAALIQALRCAEFDEFFHPVVDVYHLEVKLQDAKGEMDNG